MLRLHKRTLPEENQIHSIIQEKGLDSVEDAILFIKKQTEVPNSLKGAIVFTLQRIFYSGATNDLSLVLSNEQKSLCNCRDRAELLQKILQTMGYSSSIHHVLFHAYLEINNYGVVDYKIGDKNNYYRFNKKRDVRIKSMERLVGEELVKKIQNLKIL